MGLVRTSPRLGSTRDGYKSLKTFTLHPLGKRKYGEFITAALVQMAAPGGVVRKQDFHLSCDWIHSCSVDQSGVRTDRSRFKWRRREIVLTIVRRVA